MRYTNFTVRLRDRRGSRFCVEVVDSPVGRMRSPDIAELNPETLDYLDRMEHPRGTADNPDELGTRLMDTDELTEFGEMLGDMLFPPRVRRMLQKSLVETLHPGPARPPKPSTKNGDASGTEEEVGLRIVLAIDDPFLSTLPWEYAYLWEFQHMRELGDQQKTALREQEIQDSDRDEKVKREQLRELQDEVALNGFLVRHRRISIVRHESFVDQANSVSADIGQEVATLKLFLAAAAPTDFGEELDLNKEINGVVQAINDVREDFARAGYDGGDRSRDRERVGGRSWCLRGAP